MNNIIEKILRKSLHKYTEKRLADLQKENIKRAYDDHSINKNKPVYVNRYKKIKITIIK